MIEWFFVCFLLFPHDRQYLRQKYRYKRNKSDKDNLSFRIEKNRRNSEKRCESIDNYSDLPLGEAEFEEAEVEVEGLISFHRILPLEDARHDDVDEVDEIDSEYGDGGSNLASSDDSKRSNEKAKHDSP